MFWGMVRWYVCGLINNDNNNNNNESIYIAPNQSRLLSGAYGKLVSKNIMQK